MAAVSRLYNPFREAGDDSNNNNNNNKGNDPFAAFNFEINQSTDFPLTTPPKKAPTSTLVDPQSPDFDPFHIVVTPEQQQQQRSPNTKQPKSHHHSGSSGQLAPKLVVKLSTHEEVTSGMKMAMDDFDATSEVTIEGTVYVSILLQEGFIVLFVCLFVCLQCSI